MAGVVVDMSKLIEYQKPYADATLKNMRKDDLIRYIRSIEYNLNVAITWNRQQAENVKDWKPVVYAHWEKHYDENGEIKSYLTCSHCHYPVSSKFWVEGKYCPNCGAEIKNKGE